MGLLDKMQNLAGKRHDQQMDLVRAMGDWVVGRANSLPYGDERDVAIDEAARTLLVEFRRPPVHLIEAARSGTYNRARDSYNSDALAILTKAAQLSK